MSPATKRIPRFPRYLRLGICGNKMNKNTQVSTVTPCDESRPSKSRLRWKKNEAARGLARITAGSAGSHLHDGAQVFAQTSALRSWVGGGEKGWFWVVPSKPGIPHKNTSDTPCKTEDEAKKAAMEYVKACVTGGGAK